MIVSGGKLLAISKVRTDGTTVSGDGVKTPIGIHSDYKVDVSSYSVEAGNSNVIVDSAYDVVNKHITFRVSAQGGGQGGATYEGEKYVDVNNVTEKIGLVDSFIASASSGWNAMKTIKEKDAEWSKDTTYTQGANINISTSNVISGRDWSPELNKKIDNTWLTPFGQWSANVEASAAALSAQIKSIPNYDDVRTTVNQNSANWNDTRNNLSQNSANWNDVYNTVNGNSANWNSVYDSYSNWSANFNTWSASVENSAADISGYIAGNENKWLNSAYEVVSMTPATIDVKSAYNAETKTITYSVSAKAGEGVNYVAGDWIDSEKLDGGTIAVSGYKNLKTKYPLYFSADPADQNTMWLIQDENGGGDKQTMICVICNGWNNDVGSSNYTNDPNSLSVAVPSKPDGDFDRASYTLHFGRPMAIQININAKFVSKNDAYDKIGEVGFNSVILDGALITNKITYGMLGALKNQYYAASTIARIDGGGNGFPTDGVDLEFHFIGDNDFLSSIDNPCISIHEITGEA